jgi:hypothetical protein
MSGGWLGKVMMRDVYKSRRHRLTRGDDGGDKALPQTSNVCSDKSCNDGGQEVAREYAAEKKWQRQLTMADGNFQEWLTERRSGNKRLWQETAETVVC